MAAPAPKNVRKIAGELVASPTDLSAAFPYGGTRLGMIRDGRFLAGVKSSTVKAEEYGGVETEVVFDGYQEVSILAVLREFDNDAIAAIYPDTFAGSVSGDRVIRFDVGSSANVKSGTVLSAGSGIPLLVVPQSRDTEEFILLYNAVPLPEESAELAFHAGEEVGLAFVCRGLPDASLRVGRIGKKVDLTL